MSVKDKIILLIKETNESLAEVSRKIGRNHSYLQQYVRYGRPSHLPEMVRLRLARHFNVPEWEFREPELIEGEQEPTATAGGVGDVSHAFLHKTGSYLNLTPDDRDHLITIFKTLDSVCQQQKITLTPLELLEKALDELERQKKTAG